MLDNNFPGGRYDDRELAEYTKALRNSAPITLPKLHSKGDYKAWKSEVPLHFEPRSLGDITYGGERYDEDLGLRRQKYAEWYSARKTKAFSALALSLSVDLRSTFKVDELRDDMEAASVLWEAITKHFEAGDGINPDYLLRELMMRMLQPNEKVDAYAEDIELKVTKLRQAKGDFADWQQASLLLSNSVRVFPDLTREYANWLNSHDRKTLKLTTVLQRLRAAEHQRQQLESQAQPASRATAQVAHVTSEHQDKGRKRSKQQRKRNKGVQDKKARTNCGNCGGVGHGWLECTETTGKPLKPELERRKKERAQGRQLPASLVNSVCVVQVAQDDEQSRWLFAGLSLTSTPSIADTMDLTCNEQPAVPPSPTYSATTPESDDECKESEPPQAAQAAQAAQVARAGPVAQAAQVVPVTPMPAAAESQAQQALQQLVSTALQRQWEDTRPRGPPPTWEQMLFHLGQGLKTAKPTMLKRQDGKTLKLTKVVCSRDLMLMLDHRVDAADHRLGATVDRRHMSAVGHNPVASTYRLSLSESDVFHRLEDHHETSGASGTRHLEARR
ncbi:hypothetical protein PF011_g7419 [Phytophthora fragariae]|uniref:Uncharacterized protein n=1 Tax=Phytophthora fragariae TaxID=53985 RepID=A0A6A3LCT0_9STRA|nr:hypothetical protein PF011_g7419 [Phytophthora fragariae]